MVDTGLRVVRNLYLDPEKNKFEKNNDIPHELPNGLRKLLWSFPHEINKDALGGGASLTRSFKAVGFKFPRVSSWAEIQGKLERGGRYKELLRIVSLAL